MSLEKQEHIKTGYFYRIDAIDKDGNVRRMYLNDINKAYEFASNASVLLDGEVYVVDIRNNQTKVGYSCGQIMEKL